MHRGGGLVYLVHPEMPGAQERLRKMDFDGYLIQPGVFGTYRLGPILGDRALADKAALAGSNTLYSATAGLPYTAVTAAGNDAASIREAMAKRRLYAAPSLYLPFIAAASFGPVALLEGWLDEYHKLHSFAETHVARWIGADCLTLSTSWDGEIRDMMDLTGLPDGIRDLRNGTSALCKWPRLGCVAAEYSWLRVGYEDTTETAFVGATVTW